MIPYIITKHAREEMTNRGISESAVEAVLQQPGQIVSVKGSLVAYQSVVSSDTETDKLLRVIVTQGEPLLRVVTVYKTSKIKKYWEEA